MKQHTVLHVLGTLGPGGAQRQLLTLFKRLDGARWKTVVCSGRGGALTEDFSEMVETHVLDKRGKVDLGFLMGVKELIRGTQPSIIQTYMFTGNTWGRLGALLAGRPRPAIIATEFNVDTWKSWLHRAVDRALLPMADAMVGNGTDVIDYLVEHESVARDICTVIHNGLDFTRAQRALGISAEERDRLRADLGLGAEHFVIGHVGRPAPVKGLDTLVDTFARLYETDGNYRLLRVSQPPLPDEVEPEKAYKARLHELGLDHAVVHHPFTTEVSPAFAVMDVQLQSSTHEGLPNVVMEGMAMERPVVVTAAGATGDLVDHKVNGWIVPVKDVDGLVEGIEYVRAHLGEASEWGRKAREKMESHFTVENVVRRHEDLYERLIRDKGLE